ncbi:MAG TPA: gamma-glutamylcyclotransferase family protein [Pseudolabrys sp.]|jgi:gamma-glutamylcyclotransferase (GGCT)/AIG2-like uncharacterized protein YtfP|nr:gamma-glutamylcyclotransferase family protein [Pseudolabrys sp.]
MTLYFAYGSNMSRVAMKRRCPQARALGVATLAGWRFIVTLDGYASVVRAAGSEVIGVLWDLTARDLAALNAYESVDSKLYGRRRLVVRHDGEAKSVLVYVARRSEEGRARPGYMEIVIDAARDWNFPADYVRTLERRLSSGLRGARAVETGEVA